MAVRRRTGIRWDRLGRVALLGTLLMILFAYASPARQWIKQSGTAGHQKQELSDLTKENRGLKHRLRPDQDGRTLALRPRGEVQPAAADRGGARGGRDLRQVLDHVGALALPDHAEAARLALERARIAKGA